MPTSVADKDVTDYFAHRTAIVEEGALVGEGAKVWHFGHVMGGAQVGQGSSLGKGVFVAGGARIGARVKIQNGVSVYDGVTLEDEVFVGPHAVFTNVSNPRAFVDRRAELQKTLVQQGATIGAGAIIVCGITIGPYAFVAAGAVVTSDVGAHALVAGNPARRIGWMSRQGHRLPEGADVACPVTGERYRIDAVGCRPIAGEAAAIEEPAEDAPVVLQDMRADARFFEPQLRSAFERVLESGAYILGEEVTRFELSLAQRLGVAHAVGVSSGTDALLASLMALGIGAGDEVITTPLSFFATVAVILRVGATPVFADVNPATQNLDPSSVRAAITARTRAILPVHLFGHPVDLALFDQAAELGIPVVEDAAQAFGATTLRGQVGCIGALGCFSFFPTKNLGALGDGGVVVTNDAVLAERLRVLRVQGAQGRYNHVLVGGNFRLDALQAAFLHAKLPHEPELTARRRAHAAAYDDAFADLEAAGHLRRPARHDGHVYHQYVVRSARREGLRHHLRAVDIETEVYYPTPLHRMPVKGGELSGPELPHAEAACRENLALPVHPWLTEDQRARVSRTIHAFFGGRAE